MTLKFIYQVFGTTFDNMLRLGKYINHAYQEVNTLKGEKKSEKKDFSNKKQEWPALEFSHSTPLR